MMMYKDGFFSSSNGYFIWMGLSRNEEQETMKRNQMMDYNLLQTQTPAHPFLLPSAHPRSTGGGAFVFC